MSASSTYSQEFKQNAVKLAVESDKPVAHTAKSLGVNANTLYTWISTLNQPEVSATKSPTEKNPYEELKRLRREIIDLKEERDILKKAAAYFAKNSR